ncbi:MAG: response regulator transcription factor [Flavisolibacter sp.]
MIEVAIVEDVAEIREGLQLIINSSTGFSCKESYVTGELALISIPITKPQVVLMDINLPGINGIECTRVLKLKCPDIQFIMSTVYEDDDNIFESLMAGATGYLLKRTEPVKILEAIKEVCEGGSPMSTKIARKVISTFQNRKESQYTAILTVKENEILKALAKGLRFKEIAFELNIGFETVRSHVRNIYEKLHVQSRLEALNKVYGHN